MGRLKVKFERLPQICESFFFRLALAGDIDFEALGDEPVPFTPYTRGERALHVSYSFTALSGHLPASTTPFRKWQYGPETAPL